ncbi:MAG: methionine adenosyltransferase [Gammaproteobacteria bacterium]|jgi:S-adenosylmethionine synthetase
MKSTPHVFVSDSVTRGHPDKLCDQVSDAIVDRYLARDPAARVTAECAVASGIVFLAGRTRSDATVDLSAVARDTIDAAGYRPAEFNGRECTIMTTVVEAADERIPVDDDGLVPEDLAARIVARDQVTAVGFACRQTTTLMPLPVVLAHELARRLDEAQADGSLGWLSPDCKTQVAVEFEGRKPRRIAAVALTLTGDQAAAPAPDAARAAVLETVVEPVLAGQPARRDAKTRLIVEPRSGLSPGGPGLHAGLTGRKTAVDSYGEYGHHGGAALSGKDPFRIDRLGAYAARYLAANVVAAGLAEECEVQVSYGIGSAEPLSLFIQTFGSGRVDDQAITAAGREFLDLRPGALLRTLRLPAALRGELFQRLAVYGHMGRTDIEVPWEDISRAAELEDMAETLA